MQYKTTRNSYLKYSHLKTTIRATCVFCSIQTFKFRKHVPHAFQVACQLNLKLTNILKLSWLRKFYSRANYNYTLLTEYGKQRKPGPVPVLEPEPASFHLPPYALYVTFPF